MPVMRTDGVQLQGLRHLRHVHGFADVLLVGKQQDGRVPYRVLLQDVEKLRLKVAKGAACLQQPTPSRTFGTIAAHFGCENCCD